MLNINQAYEEAFSMIESNLKKSSIRLNLMNVKDSLLDGLKTLINEKEETTKEVETLYMKVIEKIKRRQTDITDKIQLEFFEQETEYRDKIREIENQIFKLDDLNKIEEKLPSMSKIGLLRGKKSMLSKIEKAMKIPS